jgi:hypothetical protein
VPPTWGSLFAKSSATSVEGVMGYPAKNRAPAAIAPSAQAWLPCINIALAIICSSYLLSYYKDGVIWTAKFTLPALDTVTFTSNFDLADLIQLEYFFGTKFNTNPAAFTAIDKSFKVHFQNSPHFYLFHNSDYSKSFIMRKIPIKQVYYSKKA